MEEDGINQLNHKLDIVCGLLADIRRGVNTIGVVLVIAFLYSLYLMLR